MDPANKNEMHVTDEPAVLMVTTRNDRLWPSWLCLVPCKCLKMLAWLIVGFLLGEFQIRNQRGMMTPKGFTVTD